MRQIKPLFSFLAAQSEMMSRKRLFGCDDGHEEQTERVEITSIQVIHWRLFDHFGR